MSWDDPSLKLNRQDPVEFRRRLYVPFGGGEKKLLGDIIQPWQDEDFRAMDPGWRCAARREIVDDPIQKVYLERARGLSKTMDIAVMVVWALFASSLRIEGCVAAGDKDQAAKILDAVRNLLDCNRWLTRYLQINKWTVRNTATGAKCDVWACDAAGNYGDARDFIVVDELTHWDKEKHHEHWIVLQTTAPKRAWCMFVVIANAGLGEGRSWQWRAMDHARKSQDTPDEDGHRWYFRSLDSSAASWIRPKDLAEVRRSLPPAAYLRLHRNIWSRGEGDALDPNWVEGAIKREKPILEPLPGFSYILGLDASISSDHTSTVIIGTRKSSGTIPIHVARVRDWAPDRPVGAGGALEVDLQEVQDTIREDAITYGLTGVLYDPHECRLSGQQLRKLGINAQPVDFVGKNLNKMAHALINGFRDSRIELYNDPLLVEDLLRLVIEERPYGMRLSATKDEHGHADRATAFAIVLPTALEIADLPPTRPDGLGNRLLVGMD
jgi:phage terminase large subunit-like protein